MFALDDSQVVAAQLADIDLDILCALPGSSELACTKAKDAQHPDYVD
ncbi:hypothetical protein [Alkalimarinus coralli]|nr:hypothetical protein [Alkalimarinus coralli]